MTPDISLSLKGAIGPAFGIWETTTTALFLTRYTDSKF
jgi:hypothetical protein